MKGKLIKAFAIVLLVIVVAVATWRITLSTISNITVTDDTCYITSFGQTNEYDYVPNL